MANEPLKLKIDVEMSKGDVAINKLKTINEKIEQSLILAKRLNNAFADFSKITTTLGSLASATKTFSSAFKDLASATKTGSTSVAKLDKALLSLENQQTRNKILEERLNQEKIKTVTVSNREVASYENTVRAMAKTEQALDKMNKKMNEGAKSSFSLKIALANFLALQADRFIHGLASNMLEFAKSCSKAGIELDALNNTFMAATGGWKQGQQEMKWLIDMSNNLGLGFGSVSDSYAKFMTSFTRSGGTVEQSRQIFEDISTAMVNLHLPAERMQGVFVALEQMANKGTVQAEELKKQLGNALPAAFELGAESMGILPAKLMDMMKAGEVFSKDFLPNFAKSVKENLGQGIDIASNQFNASIGRLNTAVSLFKMEIGQSLNDALKPLVNLAIPVVNALANMAKFFNENAIASATLKGALLGLTVATIPALISLIVQVKVALLATIPALASINIALGGLPIIIGSVVTGLSGLGIYLKECSKQASDVTPYMSMREQLVELTKSVTGLNLNTDEGREALQKYKEQFPQLTQYLIDNKKSLDQLTDSEFEQIKQLGELDKKQQILIEREKELNSWQATLSATFEVAWDNIKKWATIGCEAVKDAINSVIDKTKVGIKALDDFFGVSKQGQINKSTRLLQDYRGALAEVKKSNDTQGIAYWTNMIAQEEKTLKILKEQDKVKNKTPIGKGKLGKGGFWGDVNDKKITNANKNAEEKLKTVEKSANTTTTALKNARAAYIGLEKETDKKTKKKKTGSTAYQKTAYEKELSNQQHTQNALAAKIRLGQATAEEEQKYIELTKTLTNSKQALKEMTMSESDLFSLKQQRLNDLEKEIKLGMYQNKNVDDLLQKYTTEKTALDELDRKWQDFSSSIDNTYEGLKKQQKIATDLYRTMLLNSGDYTQTQIDEQANILKTINYKMKEIELETKKNEAFEISKRNAKQFSDSMIDALLSIGSTSENVFESFKNAGVNAIKSIAAEWAKNKIDGFINNLLQGVQGAGGWGSFLKSGVSVSLGSGKTQSNNPVEGLGSSVENAANSLTSSLNPALEQTAEKVSFMSSPINAVTNQLFSMATSTPISAISMGAMATSMSILSPACTQCAPALTQMSAALQGIATNAAQAATAMAELAVATAAESVAKIPYVGGFLAPIAAAATGAAIAAGGVMAGVGIAAGSTIAGGGQALGNNLSKLGAGSSKVVAHAKGGVVSSPTTFPMAGGNIGLAGEAGTEVIAPARRMSNGEVGIGAVAPNVTVNNYANAAVEVIRRPDNEMEIKITELNAMLSSSRSNKGFTNASQRMQQKGRQIG